MSKDSKLANECICMMKWLNIYVIIVQHGPESQIDSRPPRDQHTVPVRELGRWIYEAETLEGLSG